MSIGGRDAKMFGEMKPRHGKQQTDTNGDKNYNENKQLLSAFSEAHGRLCSYQVQPHLSSTATLFSHLLTTHQNPPR